MTPESMTPERWRVVNDVVQAALDRPASARAAFVAEACGGDAALRAEVESLLTGPDTAAQAPTNSSRRRRLQPRSPRRWPA